jgi:hypothetical protein
LIITSLVYWGEGHIYRFCSKMAKVELEGGFCELRLIEVSGGPQDNVPNALLPLPVLT